MIGQHELASNDLGDTEVTLTKNYPF